MGLRSEMVVKKCKNRVKTSCIPLFLATKSDLAPCIEVLREIDCGFIDLMESIGGHTKIRHIAWSNEDLIIRAHKQNITAATCFMNKQIANKSIKENIMKNAFNILNWVKDCNSPKRAVFECSHNYIVGKGVKRNCKHIIYGLTRTRIVLQKSPNVKYGFQVITGYCTLENGRG